MSDDGGFWLLALCPAGGTAFHWAIYRYYRNTDKSHAFGRETTLDAKPVAGSERKVDTVTGSRQSRLASWWFGNPCPRAAACHSGTSGISLRL